MFSTNLMRRFLAVLLSIALLASTNPAMAAPAIQLQRWGGTIDFEDADFATFTMDGTASHLGLFSADGEVFFEPDGNDGAMLGTGVVAFRAANGDRLVGLVHWEVDAGGDMRHSDLSFSWRDSVSFSDGEVAQSTGRFADAANRPPGLVVIAIIAILIATLVPCVQRPTCANR